MDKYQTLKKRFGAMVVDSFVLIPASLIISGALLLIGVRSDYLASTVTAFFSVAYYILSHYYYGQTVGKKVVKVKVVDVSEKPLNLGQAIMRSLPQLIPVMFAVSASTADRSAGSAAEFWERTIYALTGAFFLVDGLVCVMSEKDRSIHDMIAGTIVVRTDV